MADLLGVIQNEENVLREAGQKEYAHDDENAFANFDHVGGRVKCICEHCGKPTRIGRMAALMVYLLKHVDGIISYVGGHHSQREDVRGRINDVRVYSALLRGMVEEAENVHLMQDWEKEEHEKNTDAHFTKVLGIP